MTTTREQLTLAAKAVGLEIHGFYGDDSNQCIYADIGPDDVIEWAPHADQADSDRMGIALAIDTEWCSGYVTAFFFPAKSTKYLDSGNIRHDNTLEGKCAAMREARLLVAVEIGRQM
jgi:hypothetical protein